MSRSNGASKSKRQQSILGLLAKDRLASQQEIRERLAYMGIEATQSTISRDSGIGMRGFSSCGSSGGRCRMASMRRAPWASGSRS